MFFSKIIPSKQEEVVGGECSEDEQLFKHGDALVVGPEEEHDDDVLGEYNQVFSVHAERNLLVNAVSA